MKDTVHLLANKSLYTSNYISQVIATIEKSDQLIIIKACDGSE